MKIILIGIVAFITLGVALFALVRWAQRKHLEELMESEGVVRRARGVTAAICFINSAREEHLRVDLCLSKKRICAFRSIWHPPFIHVPFQDSAFEMMLTTGLDHEKRSYLGLGGAAQQAEVRFLLADAREWLHEIEHINNPCSPDACQSFDPAVCGSGVCPIITNDLNQNSASGVASMEV